MDSLQQLNERIFFFINGAMKHPVNDLWLGYTTFFGDAIFVYPAMIVLLYFIDRQNYRRNFLVFLLTAILGLIVTASLKSFFNAPRPLAYYESAIKQGRVVVNVLFEPYTTRSFPSGHSQVCFTVAATLAWILKHQSGTATVAAVRQWIWALYLCAVIGAISRIYVGVHFPVDVVAGSLVGFSTAQLGLWIAERRIAARAEKTQLSQAPGTFEKHR
ncbi:MAG: phosphatase PAP2 family protein [Rhizobacter sp.]|nr:phosphatase PAP2 family protein [Chlorobiales bacterium]